MPPDLVKAHTKLDKAVDTASEELELQWRRHDFIHAQRTSIELAEEKGEARGRQEGRQEGIQEGRQEALRDVARNLLDLLDDETIALKTGLTLVEISQLRS